MSAPAKATNQGAKVWPNMEAPQGFMQGPYPSGRKYSNPPAPGKVRGTLGTADVGAVEHALKEGSGRITKINESTRAGIRRRINEAIEQGMSPAEAGAYVREWTGFDEYRAERIARTEMMFSFNAAATRTYQAMGITQVVADDGDEDEECAARHGQVFSVDEAMGIEDHPNGTLDWLPVEPTMGREVLTGELNAQRPIANLPSFTQAEIDNPFVPTPALPSQVEVEAKQALAHMHAGVDITDAEGKMISQALKEGHVTSDEFHEAYKELNQRKLAKKLLERVANGENLTATDMDALDKAIDLGHLTSQAVDDALKQGVAIQAKKQAAMQMLDQVSQGQGGYLQANLLADAVQQGVITQQQLDQAYLAAQVLKQKQGIQAAIDAMAQDTATAQQKQLVMDAISQGALDPAQQTQLQQIILKQAAAAQVKTQAELELDNALFQIKTQYATGTEKNLILKAVNDGQITAAQEKQLGQDLLARMLKGQDLDMTERSTFTLLRGHNSISNAELRQYVLDKLESGQKLSPHDQLIYSDMKVYGYLTDQDVAEAIAKAPVGSAANPATTPAPSKVTKLKPKKAKPDTFDPATFQPKPYASRSAHDKALHAWQRNTNSKLSWEAKQAMTNYTNSGYRQINETLRGIDLASKSAGDITRLKQEAELVRESMHPISQDVVVRRGMSSRMFSPDPNASKLDLDEVMRTVTPGSEWIDEGFMSTSINRGHSWSGDVLLELKVPKGTSAAYAQAISQHKSEFEILLDAGTRIVVESIDRPTFGQVHIVAHVVR